MKRWNCPVSQWAFPFTFTPRLTEGRSFPSKTNIGITGNAKRRQRRKKRSRRTGFVFGKPAVKSRIEHKCELAIKRIKKDDNDVVDTFHKL